MATLRYQGRKAGYVPFIGKVTKRLYRFGRGLPIQEVDDADLPGLLLLREGKASTFVVMDVPVVEVGDPTEITDADLGNVGGAGAGETPIPVETPVEPQADEPAPTTELEPQTKAPFDFTVLSGIGEARSIKLHEASFVQAADFLAADAGDLIAVLGRLVTVEQIDAWKRALQEAL